MQISPLKNIITVSLSRATRASWGGHASVSPSPPFLLCSARGTARTRAKTRTRTNALMADYAFRKGVRKH